MTRPQIALVTDTRHYGDRLLCRLRDAAQAGVDLIQIRERSLDDRSLLRLVEDAIRAASATTARVIVNDRLDVAMAAGAAGVHLPADGIPAADARAVAPPGFIIGRSVHGVEEATAVEKIGGCDYLFFGTVFPSQSKPERHPVQGLKALAEVCAAVRLPVIAIGGIDIANTEAVARAGAAGVAAIRLFAGEDEARALVATLHAAFDRGSRVV